MVKKPVVIVTGATGLVGHELVSHFSQKGWQVHALVRNTDPFVNTAQVTYFSYDMTDHNMSDEAFKKADYLVHTAYIAQSKAYPNPLPVNVTAAKRLLMMSRKHKLKRNVFLSSMSVQEDATSAYSKQKAAIEKLFNQPTDTVIRSGLVLGNGGLAQRMVNFMRTKHAAPLIDSGNQPLQVIGAYDLARVIDAILSQDIAGRLTIGTPDVYSYREFYLMLRDAFHLKVLFIPVPFAIPLYTIRLINLLHLPLGVTEDNLRGLKRLKAFETSADLIKLGIELDPLETILKKVSL